MVEQIRKEEKRIAKEKLELEKNKTKSAQEKAKEAREQSRIFALALLEKGVEVESVAKILDIIPKAAEKILSKNITKKE